MNNPPGYRPFNMHLAHPSDDDLRREGKYAERERMAREIKAMVAEIQRVAYHQHPGPGRLSDLETLNSLSRIADRLLSIARGES
jgi:hypothetical protein